MAHGTIEHVNITVTDPARSVKLFQDLLGWKIRWRGPSLMGGQSTHVGNDDNYLAIYTNEATAGVFAKGVPLNHVGLQVADLAEAERVVIAHGLQPFSHSQYDPGPASFYFFDWDGIEFEVVCYE